MLKNVAGFLVFTIMINSVLFAYFDLNNIDFDTSRETILTLPELERSENVEWSKNDQEVICLAENIFHEARNQSVEGMQAVGFVTLNRVDHVDYPDSVCEVVYEPFQFSWTIDVPVVSLSNKIERVAWEQSLQVSLDIMNGVVYNSLYGVTHYHTTKVDPIWNRDKALVAYIDDHVFYRSN